jgi:uncharacterized damage-inducible protein DinB
LFASSKTEAASSVLKKITFSEFRMNTIPLWFERTFGFSFPQELYPNICMRLRGTPARLEETVRDRSRESLIMKPERKWSAQEHAGHLLDLEPLWLARVDDFVSDGTELTVADLRNRKTDEADHNAHPLDAILSNFRQARMKLMNRVETLNPSAFGRTLLHPRMKTPMRLIDHLYFVAEHDDHHLAHIWELLKSA